MGDGRSRLPGISLTAREFRTVVCLSGLVQIKSFRAPAAPESLSLCVAKEKDNHCTAGAARTAKPARGAEGRMPGVKRKATPLGACRPSGNRSCVASTPASMPSPVLAKWSRHPCRLPPRGLSTLTHRHTGAPGRAASHPGPHSSEEPRQQQKPHEAALFFTWRKGPAQRRRIVRYRRVADVERLDRKST